MKNKQEMSTPAGKRMFQFQEKSEAENKYNELIKTSVFESVYFIRSDHWASEGYWVECFVNKKFPNLSELDYVIKQWQQENNESYFCKNCNKIQPIKFEDINSDEDEEQRIVICEVCNESITL